MHINDADFNRLRTYMQANFGINLERKRTLIEGRLSALIAQEGFEGFTDFLDSVFADKSGKKIESLLTRLTTNYTYFMREDAHYKFLTDYALPEWTRKIKNHDLRIWSAGCSSGEEPYTLAMVISEYFGSGKGSWDTKILATDISTKVLALAKNGVYGDAHLERMPETWVSRYFTMSLNVHGETEYSVKPSLKDEVIFGQFNLMGPFSRFKKKFHVIFCRNVMIYFDNPTKSRLADKFYDVLESGGYLIIGQSESLSGINSRFTQIQPSIYRKE
jgi:chemotaxis protein methyltransferase CheR